MGSSDFSNCRICYCNTATDGIKFEFNDNCIKIKNDSERRPSLVSLAYLNK